MSEFSNEYRVGDSRGYAGCSVLLHAGAALMLLLTDVMAGLSLPAVAIVGFAWLTLVAAALHDLRRNGICRGGDAIAKIAISTADKRWRLCCRSGRLYGPAHVTAGRVMGAAIWLDLRDEPGRQEAICIPADAMSPQAFRRLRVAARRALGQ